MIYLDMDEVICDFLEKLIKEYNSTYNKDIKKEDIKEWQLEKYVGKEGIALFHKPGFFADLEPIDQSLEVIRLLQYLGKEMFVISSPTNEHCFYDKYRWIKEYMPFFPVENLILVKNKGDLLSQIKGGILFDDCPEYLERFNGVSVCMDMPYNQDAKCDLRVEDWWEFYGLVRGVL